MKLQLRPKLKKVAIIETDNTILVTDKITERKDFIIVLGKPAPKSKLYNIILNNKRYIGYKVALSNNVKDEIAQEVIRKQIVYQIVKGLVRKKFDFYAFAFGASVGYIIHQIVAAYQNYAAQQQIQPTTPGVPVEITNPFAPLSSAIMIVGIIAVIAYFAVNMFKTMKERFW